MPAGSQRRFSPIPDLIRNPVIFSPMPNLIRHPGEEGHLGQACADGLLAILDLMGGCYWRSAKDLKKPPGELPDGYFKLKAFYLAPKGQDII
jgi:hypothetical protein